MNAPANISNIDHAAVASIELEQEILGEVLVANSALEIIAGEVSAEDFSEPLHGQLFETFASVRDMHGAITPSLIIASMGGDASGLILEGVTVGQYVARLAAAACVPGNARAYAQQIRELSDRRKILATTETLSIGIQ